MARRMTNPLLTTPSPPSWLALRAESPIVHAGDGRPERHIHAVDPRQGLGHSGLGRVLRDVHVERVVVNKQATEEVRRQAANPDEAVLCNRPGRTDLDRQSHSGSRFRLHERGDADGDAL